MIRTTLKEFGKGVLVFFGTVASGLITLGVTWGYRKGWLDRDRMDSQQSQPKLPGEPSIDITKEEDNPV